MERIKPTLPAISIFCIALLERIVYNMTVALGYTPTADSLGYQIRAFYLLDEHCFCAAPHIETVVRAPLWPFLIAGISLIVGRANIFDRLFLCCADAGTCVLIYLFTRDLFNKRIGLVVGLIACIYPALFIYTGWMYTETLYTFLQTAICYCVFRIQRGGGTSKPLWILCGILLGLLSLTHPNGILICGLVILWAVFLIWRKRLPKRALINVALTTLIACAVIAPWTIRNYLASHRFVPVSTGAGEVLMGAYNDKTVTDKAFLGSWIRPGLAYPPGINPEGVKPPAPGSCQGHAACEVASDNTETAIAIQWVKSHLNDIPLLMVYHLRNFFTPYTNEYDIPLNRFPTRHSTRIVLAMSETLPIPIFLLAALGLVVTRRKYWHEFFFAYLVVLGTLAEILFFYGNSRFRSPIEPILLLLTAGALWWLTQTTPSTLRWQLSQRSQRLTSTHKFD
ncbi:MAG: glycosyltransferase family 39 protein [Ktedonobacteraceae bacterium]